MSNILFHFTWALNSVVQVLAYCTSHSHSLATVE
uniref:Uncharacterized protein n=1 Tax=Arundo donax TaxID=35708 RepID=A0A0A8ZEN8_ARUDO